MAKWRERRRRRRRMVGDGAPRRVNNRGGMKFPHKSLAGRGIWAVFTGIFRGRARCLRISATSVAGRGGINQNAGHSLAGRVPDTRNKPLLSAKRPDIYYLSYKFQREKPFRLSSRLATYARSSFSILARNGTRTLLSSFCALQS